MLQAMDIVVKLQVSSYAKLDIYNEASQYPTLQPRQRPPYASR